MASVSVKSFLYGPVAAMITIALLIGAYEYRVSPWSRVQITTDMILENDTIVQNHLRVWGVVPETLNELRLFARENGRRLNSYDAWGERIDYLRLDPVNYLIRSFGEDGIQNRPNSDVDLGVSHLGPLEPQGLQYNAHEGVAHPRLSAVLFAGSSDDSGKWAAKIFVDPMSGAKHLIVRSQQQKDLVMMANHDGVEEFLWLPNHEKIVFTASHSLRYPDGLYVWDLKTDDFYNLFNEEQGGATIEMNGEQKRLHMALAYVTATTPSQIGVFEASAVQSRLDPKKFFHPQSLHVFILDQVIKHIRPLPDAATKASVHDTEFLGSMTVVQGGTGTAIQKAWLGLPMGGDWEESMIAWQDFAAQHSKTQLAPYAVFGLSIFYSDAAAVAGLASKEGKAFAGLSAEMGNTLNSISSAPGYLRAIGAWLAQPEL